MIRELAEYITSRALRGRDMVARAMPGPMLVRIAVWTLGVLSLAIAYPSDAVFDVRGGLSIVLFALVPAVFPRTRMVSFLLFTAVLGWLVRTAGVGEPITAVRLVALAGALYLLHSSAALAAVLPYDTVVAPRVLLGWFTRALAVVGITAVIGVVAVAGSGLFGGRTFLVASLAGIGLVCVLAWLLLRLARRDEGGSPS